MNEINKLLSAAYFAAVKHKKQTRKGSEAEPYINHPLDVARILSEIGEVENHDVLIAAILHDTIEDTETTVEEIVRLFGENVASIVMEVTDDISLPKSERKRLQIDHAPHLSILAKQLKMADKISNIKDVASNPPAGWSVERRIDYIEWGEKVMAGLRGANKNLEDYFDDLVCRAKSNIH
jgi:GTP diphosphokinase / guanosine-3',5'-bis(diphosphate) 3'-diphosphatase